MMLVGNPKLTSTLLDVPPVSSVISSKSLYCGGLKFLYNFEASDRDFSALPVTIKQIFYNILIMQKINKIKYQQYQKITWLIVHLCMIP